VEGGGDLTTLIRLPLVGAWETDWMEDDRKYREKFREQSVCV
jgi:hypothetical protein